MSLVSCLTRTALRAAAAGLLALLAACTTARLPDAPKTVGSSTKANPHYKVGAPYKIDGRWYTPKAEPTYVETGVASWYGDAFHGKLTANGEIFDKTRISAAHRTLPMPTIAEVENLANGKRIIVRVNDRGPFARDRIIDLSHAAADALGFTLQGTAQVRVRYLADANLADLAPKPKDAGRAFAAYDRRGALAATPAAAPSANTDPLAGLIASATTAPLAPAAAPVATTDLWVEVAEVDDVSKLAQMRLYIPGEGPIALHAKPQGSRTVQCLRLGPFVSEAGASASLARALAAGFPGARIISGAGH
ncbi:MAG: septal ring lytic transglycosylase RlpA family protein [Parvularculaceae bacterium]|nr:septal ring lytic transglycosylase RlpA family protein [Parvularculaceae bacterium]